MDRNFFFLGFVKRLWQKDYVEVILKHFIYPVNIRHK